MAASWGDVETYENMISALGDFNGEVSDACQVMITAASQCAEALQNDVASLKASRALLQSTKKYQQAIQLANQLAVDLKREEEELIELMKKMDALEGEG